MAGGTRSWLARALTVLVLFFALPGVSDVVDELVALATGVDACGAAGCDEQGGPCCPGMCTRCPCCAHPTLTPPPPALGLAAESTSREPPAGAPLAAYASGYRAELFRPPSA